MAKKLGLTYLGVATLGFLGVCALKATKTQIEDLELNLPSSALLCLAWPTLSLGLLMCMVLKINKSFNKNSQRL